MEIKYIVSKCETCQRGIATIEDHFFSTVEQAIEFKEKQKDGYFSWWEITVGYNKDK